MSIYYLYVLLLISGLLICTAVIALTIYKNDSPAIAFNPAVLFSTYFGVIHFLTPLTKHLEGQYRYQNEYQYHTYITIGTITLVLYLLAIIINFAMQITLNIRKKYRAIVPRYQKINQLIITAITIFTIGVFAAYLDYKTLTEVISLDAFLADRHQASEERSSLRIFSNLMIVGFALYSASISTLKKSRNRKLHMAAATLMVLIAFAYYSLISSRNSFLLLILLGMTCFVANHKPRLTKVKSRTKTFLMMGFITTFILVITYILTVQRYSISDTAYAQDRLNNVGLYMLDGAFGNDEALLWMKEKDYTLLGGLTYLAGITNIIPRVLWPEKPLGGGPELINMIFPGSYVIGADKNNSLTTGLLTEAMMNFGIIGLLLAIITWSLLANYFTHCALRSKTLVQRTFYLILTTSLSSAFLYSEFLGFMVRIGVYLTPLILISIAFPRAGRNIN